MFASLPTRERELKLRHRNGSELRARSLPTRERELKRGLEADEAGCGGSLPTRERELKRGWRLGGGVPLRRSLHGSVN